jgi:(p)ppGpp synthase/HD superfamily hydrolase
MAIVLRSAGRQLAAAHALMMRAHADQVDKSGEPYYLHPERVGFNLTDLGPVAVAAGFLHDVVEDTPVTLDEVREQFGPDVAAAVDAVTRRKADGETYRVFIQRAAAHPVGRWVKLADIQDNVSRLPSLPSEAERESLGRRYQDALAWLSVT